MEDGGGAPPSISMEHTASSENAAVDLELLEQLLSSENGWLEVATTASRSPSYFASPYTTTTTVPPASANNTLWMHSSSTFRQRLYQALDYIRETQRDIDVLVQLWLPFKGNDGQLVLTTSQQPYTLDKRSEILKQFRDVSTQYQFSADVASESLPVGLPGRVFIGKLPEWSPDVRYFTRYEEPRLNDPQSLTVHATMGLPVFEQGNYNCLGVLELIMTRHKLNFTAEINNICSALQAVNLRSTEVSSIPRTKLNSDSYRYRDGLLEILQVLRATCITHRLPLAQTWVTCAQQGKRGSRHSDENYRYCISTVDVASYVSDPWMQMFHDACSEHHLLRGQGVAGKAFTTNQLCFLPDIGSSTKLEYPLSHHAKILNLKGAVAIRLRCTRTGTADFVLEFFLPTDCEALEEQKALLDSLSGTMHSACQTLRVVTEKEMEDEAMLEMNELNSFGPQEKNRVEELSLGDKYTEHREETSWKNLEGHSQKESDLAEQSIHGGQSSSLAGIHTSVQGSKGNRRTKTEKTGSLQVLPHHFAGSLKDAAKSLGGEEIKMQATSVLPNYQPYHLLEEITNGFSDERKLGSGAYGKVYLGVNKDGEKVAVKVLYDMPTFEDNEKLFQSEFKNLASVQHQNIVRLVGYCHETQQMYVSFNGGHTFAGQIRRAFCLEYMHKGSLDKYLADECNKNDWPTRYAIIKGICNGLKYLHSELESPIYHLDLKPANILLDENMQPKIADFGLSRLLGVERTQKTLNRKGTLGYIPPEYINTGEISSKFDIFSLGVVITKIMTGPDGYFRSDEMSPEQFTEIVHEEWKNKLYTSPMDLYSEQVKICIKIAVNCMEFNRHKRPSIDEIVYELDGINDPRSTTDQINVVELLNVDPLQLFFPLFDSNTIISRPLRLTNNTDEKVAFRCLPEPQADGFLSEIRGIVPPRSAHTYFVTMEKPTPANTDAVALILESCLADEDVPDPDDHFLTEFREQIRGRVHEVTLTAVCSPGEIMIPERMQTRTKIISLFNSVRFVVSNSMDVHPTQPWISVGQHDGHISVWDYESEARVMSPLRITEGNAVRSTRFIAREDQWIVVGDGNGDIHVHSLVTMGEVKKFKAHQYWVQSLSVHPSLPLLLSASVDKLIKLWNWEEDWACIRTFKGHTQDLEIVMFNPWNYNTFVSVSLDCTIKVWNTSSSRPDATLGCKPHQLLCFDYFPPGNDGQYVVAGSLGGNAHIWDLKTQKCTRVIEGLQRGIGCNVGVVDCGPDDPPLLFTVSEDNTIFLCNSTTYRCEKTGYVFNLGNVCSFVYLKRIRSVAIGFERGLAILEID